MTQKEREHALCALSSIRSCISELKYYKRAGWLSDEGALDEAESALESLNKLMKK